MDATVRSSLMGAGIGATCMFLLDPARGARRRALIYDKLVRAAHKTGDAAAATQRDFGNRICGLTARVRGRWSANEAGDWTIRERVRAELGRVASHPRAISVRAHGGWVTLSGDVRESEVSAIVAALSRVRGVQGVQNNMTLHMRADGIPALQGESERPDQWSTWLREGWSPTAMVLAGAGTAALMIAAAAARRAA